MAKAARKKFSDLRIVVEKSRKEIKMEELQSVREVKGIIASKGIATGTARIVHTNLDLKKIQKGDIMVAHMTRQDYVPFMRKCKGFITDEGGVTAHTAIIAREMSMPCIVGTHIATRVFRDGDEVELDASNGVARKI